MSTCCGVSGAASPGSSTAPSMANVTAEEMEETGIGKQKYEGDAMKQYFILLVEAQCFLLRSNMRLFLLRIKLQGP